MRTTLLIARRELTSYLRSWTGYVIIALILFITGLLFNTYGLGNELLSAQVLRTFFFFSSGTIAVACIPLSMRLLAEERQTGTIALLYSSPVTDLQIVVGKYLASVVFLLILLATTVFMPLLVMVNGKISFGHVFSGYAGLLLLGGAILALGTLGSALAGSQIIAVIVTAVMVVSLYCFVFLGQHTERPLNELFGALACFIHFEPFSTGVIHLRDVAYFLGVIYVSLFCATRVLEARRWR
jgi:ABC-2 type transport system permease protein